MLCFNGDSCRAECAYILPHNRSRDLISTLKLFPQVNCSHLTLHKALFQDHRSSYKHPFCSFLHKDSSNYSISTKKWHFRNLRSHKIRQNPVLVRGIHLLEDQLRKPAQLCPLVLLVEEKPQLPRRSHLLWTHDCHQTWNA